MMIRAVEAMQHLDVNNAMTAWWRCRILTLQLHLAHPATCAAALVCWGASTLFSTTAPFGLHKSSAYVFAGVLALHALAIIWVLMALRVARERTMWRRDVQLGRKQAEISLAKVQWRLGADRGGPDWLPCLERTCTCAALQPCPLLRLQRSRWVRTVCCSSRTLSGASRCSWASSAQPINTTAAKRSWGGWPGAPQPTSSSSRPSPSSPTECGALWPGHGERQCHWRARLARRSARRTPWHGPPPLPCSVQRPQHAGGAGQAPRDEVPGGCRGPCGAGWHGRLPHREGFDQEHGVLGRQGESWLDESPAPMRMPCVACCLSAGAGLAPVT